MTSTTLAMQGGTVNTKPHSGVSWWFSDVWEMTLRNIRHVLRSPELVMFSLVQPVMFILLFTYVFGGAINVGGERYSQFLLPGIFVQMVLYGSAAGTTIGIATEMREGLMDRFRSMPMSRPAVLVGRTLSEIFRNVCVLAVTVGVGLLVGFRFRNGFLPALAGMLLLLFFGYAVSWFAAFLGLSVRNAEAAQAVGGVWIFPFTLISSAFVPTSTMPGWLQAYAAHSPMTAAVNALRALFTGGPAGSSVLQTLAWSVGLIVVFAPLSVRKYGSR
ncbi:ABC transporter permease [Streptomyces sp. NPDC020801]|uniref:ABC transporter permease n=1 Tax=unclassified Streptomyces TaxID=2593676 RepID=UPI0037AFA006